MYLLGQELDTAQVVKGTNEVGLEEVVAEVGVEDGPFGFLGRPGLGWLIRSRPPAAPCP